MKDYIIVVVYEDYHKEVQQELFELQAKSHEAAERWVRRVMKEEGNKILNLVFRRT